MIKKNKIQKEINVVPEVIERRILLIRGQKVMLDFHLAELYDVETKTLKRAVKRNLDRFPTDFMFALTPDEYTPLRYQFGTLKRGAHSKYHPNMFTEIMAHSAFSYADGMNLRNYERGYNEVAC